MRILVTGSRRWADEDAVWMAIVNEARAEPLVIVHGDCPTGADAIAKAGAEWMLDTVQEAHPADWSQGRGAGPRRNQEMVDLGADLCLAFPLGESPGTKDCMRRALAAGIPLHVVTGGRVS